MGVTAVGQLGDDGGDLGATRLGRESWTGQGGQGEPRSWSVENRGGLTFA